ncbi:hypothetical protein MMC22_003378 [Lobaria immixta]|nr:hypothetical protein [Lobaria immixta]
MASAHPFGIEVLYPGEGLVVADIIFVHGLRGHRRKTWSKDQTPSEITGPLTIPQDETAEGAAEPKFSRRDRLTVAVRSVFHRNPSKNNRAADAVEIETSLCWPESLLPSVVPNARIMTYGYDANVAHIFRPASSNTVFQHAQNLLAEIDRHRDDAIKALESSRNTLLEHLKEIYPKTHGIVFLGTPHRGSNTASLGSIAASVAKAIGHDANTSIVRSLEVNSETLDKISDAFSRSLALQDIRAYSFREELGITNIKGVRMVVEPFSAVIGDAREGKESMNANHLTMTKYDGEENQCFLQVSAVIRRFIQQASSVQSLSTDVSMLPFGYSGRFRGREEILQRIHDIFNKKLKTRVVLTGLGGAGKTALAKEFVFRCKARGTLSVYWVNADNTETLSADFVRIFKHLKNSNQGEPQNSGHQSVEEQVDLVRWSLSNEVNWLLVFDNADDIKLNFDRFLPPFDSGMVLFTSRDSRLASLLARTTEIKIGAMAENEATELMRSIAGRDELSTPECGASEACLVLVRKLHCFALAVVQAASHLKLVQGISVQDYLRFLHDETERQKLLAFQHRFENYNHTVMTTWELSFAHLSGDVSHQEAAKLLQLLGFLNLEGVTVRYLLNLWEEDRCSNDAGRPYGNSIIPCGLLQTSHQSHLGFLKSKVDLATNLSTLENLSLLSTHSKYTFYMYGSEVSNDRLITLHPLVHEWIRQRLRVVSTLGGEEIFVQQVSLAAAITLHNYRLLNRSEYFWKSASKSDALRSNSLYGIIVQSRQLFRPSQIEAFLLLIVVFFMRSHYTIEYSNQIGVKILSVDDESPIFTDMIRSSPDSSSAHMRLLWTGILCIDKMKREIDSFLGNFEHPFIGEIRERWGRGIHSFDRESGGVENKTENDFETKFCKLPSNDPTMQAYKEWKDLLLAFPDSSELSSQQSWYSTFQKIQIDIFQRIHLYLLPKCLALQCHRNELLGLSDILDLGRILFCSLRAPSNRNVWTKIHHFCRCQGNNALSRLNSWNLASMKYSLMIEFEPRAAEEEIWAHVNTFDVDLCREGAMVQKIADCMKKYRSFEERSAFYVRYCDAFFMDEKGILWDLRIGMFQLAREMIAENSESLEKVETLLFQFMVSMARSLKINVSATNSGLPLWSILHEFNQAKDPALTLAEIYTELKLWFESSVLVAWIIETGPGGIAYPFVKTILESLARLEFLSEEGSKYLQEVADRPRRRIGKKRYTSGPREVLKNEEFQTALVKLRNKEKHEQLLRKRFLNCLQAQGNEAIEYIDQVWETMCMSQE